MLLLHCSQESIGVGANFVSQYSPEEVTTYSIFSIFASHTQAIQDPLKPFKFLEGFFDLAE
jgi:hypothetical protein